MKNLAGKAFLLSFFLLISSSVFAHDLELKGDSETFVYQKDGKSYTMQKYFIVFLKKRPNRNQSKEEQAKIQTAHLAYLGDLYEKGILNLNGPTDGNSDIQGFSVYNVPKIEHAKKLASNDPAVKAGRLIIEVKPWWLAKGSSVE